RGDTGARHEPRPACRGTPIRVSTPTLLDLDRIFAKRKEATEKESTSHSKEYEMTSSTHSTHTIWFTDPAGTDIDKVGGQGPNLGRLANAGCPVPPGFVVDTSAYLAHIEPIRDRISRALAEISYDDAEALEKAVEQIRGWIIATDMPADIAAGIKDAYAQ